jgi:hypothetical protein
VFCLTPEIDSEAVVRIGERPMSMAAQPNPQILESKLRRPWVRPGIVSRTSPVDRLLASHHMPVVSVVAPAGYGKTTLLSQWAEQWGPTAWVSPDERDNDLEILPGLRGGGVGPSGGDRP